MTSGDERVVANFRLPSLLTVRRTLKSGLTPEEALALGLTDCPDPEG